MSRRVDNEMGINANLAQSYLTWGSRRSLSVAGLASTNYTFPIATGVLPIPGLGALEQMVDIRYKRPTTWSIHLYFEAPDGMLIGDFSTMLWRVNTSVGSANNTLTFDTTLPPIATTRGAGFAKVLTNIQIAAHTIQVTPFVWTYGFGPNPPDPATRNIRWVWSAWAAPIVD